MIYTTQENNKETVEMLIGRRINNAKQIVISSIKYPYIIINPNKLSPTLLSIMRLCQLFPLPLSIKYPYIIDNSKSFIGFEVINQHV